MLEKNIWRAMAGRLAVTIADGGRCQAACVNGAM